MSSDDDASVSSEGDDAVFTEKSDQSDSDGDDDEESTPPRGRKRKLSSDESFSSDDSYGKKKKRKKVQKKPSKAKSTPRTPRKKDVKKLVYKEDESESEEDEESEVDDADLLEDDDTMMTEVSMQVDDSNAETIEKVLKHREGIPGATGPPTTAYNVDEKGDPNQGVEDKDPNELERQFLIKWVGWSHLHNTWESLKSLNNSNVKGIKKLENYIKKLDELEFWKSRADKEYIEHYDCEQEMNDELLDEYKKVERVIAHQVSREKNIAGEKVMEYLIKWACLPYSDCTWEDEGLIQQTFATKIDEYYTRINSTTLPNKNNAGMFTKKRPKFVKLEEMPDFLRPVVNPEMELRDYQLQGLNWLLHAWSRENSCILADEMGLGKTIQTISFLSSLFHLHDVHGPFLIVVPLSTMTAWQREFELWAPTLNAVVYMGDVNSRDQIRQYELLFANNRKIKVNALLTTYEILLKDKAFLSGFDWAALMVDEAHRLKNDESLLYQCLRSFRTAHRLLITGTPLQNSLKELWALLHFIMPDKFYSWPEFEQEHEDRDHKGISALHKKLEPYLLRRVKKDVEKSLPAKVEQILRVDMTAQQKQYYKWILTRNYQELSKGVKGSINGFVNLIMELKKCCNHCSLVRRYDDIATDAQSRLQQLLKSSGKLILLDKLLCRLKETGHRVLIFSQMVMMLDILQEYMSLRRFNTQRLDGSMRADLRKQALDHFNAPGSTDFCFLLSTRAGGLGINLATADTVIIFDSDWNPQNDLQAMSRAHRIGQKKQVNIYRFVTKASVEEEIVERAKKKLVLDHLVIQRMDTTGKTVLSKNAVPNPKVPFDKADLNAILKFGAEELFREKEGEEQEPEVDIDDILTRAETRECENQANDNELLSAFKYANFALDEEKDIAAIGTAKSPDEAKPDKEWDEIIPQEQLQKLKEEEKRKAEEELNLAPRQRNKIYDAPNLDDAEDGKGKYAEESSEDEDEKAGKRGPYKKKVLFNFTEIEIRKFAKSLRKFAHPLERLDAIAQDAELEEHSSAEMNELTKEVLKRCEEASNETEKPEDKSPSAANGKKKPDRGPIVKIGTVDIYVRPILKQHNDLEALHIFMKNHEEAINPKLKLPSVPKAQHGWDIEWDVDDDISILRGIYKYGVGSWEAIKMDPELGLDGKIMIKDKMKKPQPKHLQCRVDYLLKLIAKSMDPPTPFRRPSEKKVKRKENEMVSKKKKSDTFEPANKKAKKDSEKHEKGSGEKKKERHEKSFVDGKKVIKKEAPQDLRTKIILLPIKDRYGEALDDQNSPTFKKCVEKFTPVSKYIKKLSKNVKNEDSDYYRYLLKLGDHITSEVEKMAVSSSRNEISTEQDKWNSYMWIFLSRFSSQNVIELHLKYETKALAKAKSHHHHESKQHHHSHHQSHSHNHSTSSSSHQHRHHHNDRKSSPHLKESSSTDKLSSSSRLSSNHQHRHSDSSSNNSFFKRPR